MPIHSCRSCGEPLNHLFIDLGISPLANSYVSQDHLQRMEPFFPLKTYVCDSCYLVQTEDHETPEHIFSEYTYFSSYSDSWLQHAKQYVDMITDKCKLTSEHQVVEIASNDGYLLQYFQEHEVPVLGIEPAANVAAKAIEQGIPSITEFFGVQLANKLVEQGIRADLLLGNNVLAHVPDINDFVAGMKLLLQTGGTITMEFPHLLRLIQDRQFDTIYHEHYSYLSLHAVSNLFKRHGLELFDVEQLPTHGGSLRIYAKHDGDSDKSVSLRITELLQEEKDNGLLELATYADFRERVKQLKRNLVQELVALKEQGKRIVGYGAPAKGNTLLNYCGIDFDYLDYTVDRSPHKQEHFLPGTRIPIHAPERLLETKPDYVLILPWNLKEEIIGQTSFIREWGGKWIVPVPEVEVVE